MGGVRNFYDRCFCWTGGLQSLILLVVRVIFGVLFAIQGWDKLTHHADVFSHFQELGIPQPDVMAWVVAGIEFGGGILLVLGFLSKLAALLLVIVMVVAYFTAHTEAVKQLFSNPHLFMEEAPFWYLLSALFILAFGPGRFSLDGWLCCRSCNDGKGSCR